MHLVSSYIRTAAFFGQKHSTRIKLSGIISINMGQKAVAVDGEVVTDGQRVLARGAVHVVRCGRQYRKVTLG